MANVLSMASFKGPAFLSPPGKCLPSKDARRDHYTVRDRLKIGLIDEASLVTISRTDPQTTGPWLQPSQRESAQTPSRQTRRHDQQDEQYQQRSFPMSRREATAHQAEESYSTEGTRAMIEGRLQATPPRRHALWQQARTGMKKAVPIYTFLTRSGPFLPPNIQ
ncbi:hypothetical protein NOR_05525 [Metarhizium rileyi]|uniref:Uncharacterized protein n=1 Tax=Metarhizium rileyi (strain RCEF 4871) TaxID=1649241 RepID=A0A162JE75_METRR|nr:hypothetical protein NOR_05525 [Metarhizium rileyi RCEF 4871]